METQRRFLTADWRHLLMLNYPVDPAILTPYLPRGTEIDYFQGTAFVSLVGFRFLNTRVLGVPIPFHRDFDEINLRFYVRHQSAGGWRRGVVFIKEIVPRWMVTCVARNVYGENYVTRTMRSEIAIPESVNYSWRCRGRWNLLGATIAGEPMLMPQDSEESFITEHYWGYAGTPSGPTMEYQVEHPRWRLWRATSSNVDIDAASEYTAAFVPFLDRPPSSAFVAEGSAIVVRRGTPVVQSP